MTVKWVRLTRAEHQREKERERDFHNELLLSKDRQTFEGWALTALQQHTHTHTHSTFTYIHPYIHTYTHTQTHWMSGHFILVFASISLCHLIICCLHPEGARMKRLQNAQHRECEAEKNGGSDPSLILCIALSLSLTLHHYLYLWGCQEVSWLATSRFPLDSVSPPEKERGRELERDIEEGCQRKIQIQYNSLNLTVFIMNGNNALQ